MDADQIRSLKPELRQYLPRFDACFQRRDTRGHLPVYVEGQLSDLPRRNCEPLADAQGIPPRTLQQFLSLLDWDHGLMKTKLHQLIAAEHASPHSVGVIDETACPKKGETARVDAPPKARRSTDSEASSGPGRGSLSHGA